MEYVYYVNGERKELNEYLEAMFMADGEYKQDVVLSSGVTIYVLVAICIH
jgi:hypothetical protein